MQRIVWIGHAYSVRHTVGVLQGGGRRRDLSVQLHSTRAYYQPFSPPLLAQPMPAALSLLQRCMAPAALCPASCAKCCRRQRAVAVLRC